MSEPKTKTTTSAFLGYKKPRVLIYEINTRGFEEH